MLCNLCPRRCNAQRTKGENKGGFCKAPEEMIINKAGLHFWEEPCISGKNGSGTIFFSGCSLCCVYCQNYEISHKCNGKPVTVRELTDIIKRLENMGADNINFVTADHYADKIAEALNIYKPKIPTVFNTSGYLSAEQISMLSGCVDIYLFDFKYINGEKAKKYSFAPDYPEVAKKALKKIYETQNECVFGKDTMLKKGIIVRHLLLPLSTNDAIEIYKTVKDIAPNAYFSLMSQYVPCGSAERFKEINRKVTKREYEKVVSFIALTGDENCYIQDTKSADKAYIPTFNIEM